jgi:nucleoside-diphosphate-sugar epimerase
VTRLARERFDYRGRVVHRVSPDANYLVDNPNRRCPRIAKARQDLGYDPQISLEEGLRRSLIWYSENREAEDA